MKQIKNIEDKLKHDSGRLKAYKKYQKYEAMLKQYEQSGIEIVRNVKLPFRYAKKIAQKNDFTFEEYELFCDRIEQLRKENPDIELNDLASQKGRNVIGDIISVSQQDDKFKVADLDGVAVLKYFYLCNEVNNARGKGNDSVKQVLNNNGISVSDTCRKLQNYKNNKRGELYERNRRVNAESIVHLTAAMLEIGPGEVESSLNAFKKPEDKYYETEFDKNIKIKEEEVSKAVLDSIIMNDKLTDDQKKEMIDAEYNKIAEHNKFIESEIKKWKNNGRDVKDLPKDFMKRNGVSIETKENDISMKSEEDERAM